MYEPIEIAQEITRIRNMTMLEMLKDCGYKKGEITSATYLYVDDTGTLCGIEKPHRRHDSNPIDEIYPIGYVQSVEGGVAYFNSLLDK